VRNDKPRRRLTDMLDEGDDPSGSASENRVHDALSKILTLDLTPPELAGQLHQTVVGQDDSVRRCAVHLRHHLKRIEHSFLHGTKAQPIPKHNILLVGPTGTGKTLLANAMAEVAGLPFHSEDLTQLSETGYVGRDTGDIVSSMVERWSGSLIAEYGLLFLDEIDKVAIRPCPTRDIRGAGVQDLLLRLIEGGPMNASTRGLRTPGESNVAKAFATDRLFVVAAGAFVGLEDVVRQRTKPPSKFGFGANTSGSIAATKTALSELMPEDLIAFGLKPELVGRFTDIIVLSDLKREQLKTILAMPGGPLDKRQRVASLEGFALRFSTGLQDAIVEEACSAGLGARMLESVVARVTARAFYEVPTKLGSLGLKHPVVSFGKQALQTGAYTIAEKAQNAKAEECEG